MSSQSDQRSFPARLFILILFAGSMINYIDRSLLGMVKPQLQRDLLLTNAKYGLAVHAFLVMYTVFYILGGRIADLLGYRRTVTLTLVWWSIASMATALVQGLLTLVLCQVMFAMGEATFYPSAMRGAAERFPPASRAKAVGAILAAISFGLLVSPPVVAWITLRYGWRATFLVFGALGLLLVPPWVLLHRRMDRNEATQDSMRAEPPDTATVTSSDEGVGLSTVLKTRKYWCVLAARGCGDAAWYFYLFWMPGYFQEARGFSLAILGKLLCIPYICSTVGAIAGAAASTALIRRGLSLHRSRKSVLLASGLACVFSASAAFVPGRYLALALVSLALFAHQSWSVNIHTVITEISPSRHLAILYGMTGAAGTLVGAAAQLVIGPLIDLYGYKPAFAWAGGMYVLAMVFLNSAGTLRPMWLDVAGLVKSPSTGSNL